MYSPGEERDESAFNLPAINFNRIPSCCTAWTPRLFSASPSPLSPISTTICFARAFSKRMSDSFLLPCAIFPPSPFYPLWPLLHTLCLSHAVCAPQPPPFLSLLQCLRMQSLPECAMSFLLGSAASFTVDWFLFRSRDHGKREKQSNIVIILGACRSWLIDISKNSPCSPRNGGINLLLLWTSVLS